MFSVRQSSLSLKLREREGDWLSFYIYRIYKVKLLYVIAVGSRTAPEPRRGQEVVAFGRCERLKSDRSVGFRYRLGDKAATADYERDSLYIRIFYILVRYCRRAKEKENDQSNVK